MKYHLFILFLIIFLVGCATGQTTKVTEISALSTKDICTPQWECTDWSECSMSKEQIRKCSDKLNCGVTKDKPQQYQLCELTENQLKKHAMNIPYDEIFRYNEKYIGNTIYYRGKIVQIGESYMIVGVADKGFGIVDGNILVDYSENKRFLEDDIIDIYGKVKGLYTYNTILGNQITIPRVTALYVDLLQKAGESTETTLMSSTVIAQNTQNGISIFLNNYTFIKKGEDYGKIIDITVTILNKGNNAFTPKVLVILHDDNDMKEEWTQPKAEIKFDIFRLKEGEHTSKKAIIDLPFNEINSTKKFILVLVEDYDYYNTPLVVIDKDIKFN